MGRGGPQHETTQAHAREVIRKLAEGDKLLGQGQTTKEVCRHLGIAESTWHRWRNQYGGMKANDAKKRRKLEEENARLRKLLAEAELDKSMPVELVRGSRAPCMQGGGPSTVDPAPRTSGAE